MRYSTSLFALAAPLLVSALPLRTRNGAPVRRAASANDALVFKFANVLEQLESQFYAQAIAKFSDSDFSDAGFSSPLIPSQALTGIQLDESTHQTFLAQGLQVEGAAPLNCSFNFDSVLTDVPTTLATARAVEYLGVSAYLGGATLLDDPLLLDSAASILTVEARHQTLLNIMSGTGSAIPQAFDIPFTPQEVLSIAGGFITGDCDLGLTPTNTLTVTNTGAITEGTLVTVSAANITSTDNLFCNMIVGGAANSINLPLAQCNVPSGINGPVALWITSDNDPLANNVVDRATTQQVAGPAIFFVDSSPETLGQLVRGSGTASGATTTQTTILSPDQASSLLAGSSATATASSSSSTDGANGAAAPSVPASTPLPLDFTGTSPDGHVVVNGVSSVAGTPVTTPASGAASATASAAASATDSAAASATDSASAASASASSS